ncbi:ABC transporter permease [Burkholderia stagnalis]|uniref:ABC transporter permease n=1 Tax=Burkholderia stagnalis TaxID=1503054 RepID=A0A107GS00_9BURK|nr:MULTISPECIES: ABC transporter permease [Burkholderia cepacia complex]KAB0639313.1 ABC transporter permease [Burkholderia stagnalis]KVL87274.1 peptide ABC transporter permease [Burkholderia stagnalis]KVL91871.1 peptide ABC transporter permease [Burkholderia stagnalis]KVM07192.1 peptide ABC transporter permease [Burkholderia stagnalis]KVM90088.1 peptide ABC transporter permease [Burkholderia stagnalis]
MKIRNNALLGGAIVVAVAAMGMLSTVWTPYDPLALSLGERFRAPSAVHLLGTDEFGRDIFSRILSGAGASLLVACLTVLMAITIGTLLGLTAGYFRGLVDRVMMVANDALLAFPGILLALGISVVAGANKYGIVLALGLAYAPTTVRLVRGTVMSLREKEYIEASRVIGNSELTTMLKHVLPNCAAPLMVLATSMFGWVILAESAMSFLGLGVPPPAPTWGNMLSSGRPFIESAPWLGMAPGLCIALTLLGINLLGDALRDWLDPRME